MAASSSMSLPLGAPLPEFEVQDVSTGHPLTPGSFAQAKALLVIFLCRHCPYVVHVRPELRRIAQDYQSKGLAILGISSNDPVNYPADAPQSLAEMAREDGALYPVGFDETQDVARAFGAACTPDFFLFDAERKLAYRGRLDDSTPGNGRPLTGADLRAAIEAVLGGGKPSAEQHPSIGCSIKWRA